MSPTPAPLTLDRLDDLAPATVLAVNAPPAAAPWRQWLEEIGFLPGETVTVTARAPGGAALVVRVGASTFALRKNEAACIEVRPQAGAQA